jgi:hypothetical protein
MFVLRTIPAAGSAGRPENLSTPNPSISHENPFSAQVCAQASQAPDYFPAAVIACRFAGATGETTLADGTNDGALHSGLGGHAAHAFSRGDGTPPR